MRVLLKKWVLPNNEHATSISKDLDQLNATIQDLSLEDSNHHDILQIEEVELLDTSVFAQMVKGRTVFLHEGEEEQIRSNFSMNV